MTHRAIKDPALRAIFARELWVLRGVARRTGERMDSPWMSGIILGLETAFRRVEQYAKVTV
jgi:hypothetical protein